MRDEASAPPEAEAETIPDVGFPKSSRLRPSVLALAICLVALLPFLGALQHGFVNFDDDVYIVDNAEVHEGLSPQSISWAFTTLHFSNWHPVTWISYLVDYELFGLQPGGYHLTSLLIHSINGGLLFLVLWRLTRALGRSAAVAALWAVHPLRVESVVWISERKDVLSLLFGLLAIEFYRRHVHGKRTKDRVATAICMALSLMAKPMLVTLPVLLIILDFWPLDRAVTSLTDLRQRVVEKWELWLLSAASCLITLQAQAGAVIPLERFALTERLKNAALSIGEYVSDQLYPKDLAVLYPLDMTSIPTFGWLAGLALVLGLSLVAFRCRQRLPYLAAGWSWFLIGLLPILGIIQVGGQARADRYAYLPSIGLFVLLVFGSWDLLQRIAPSSNARRIAGLAFVLALVASATLTIRQVTYWHDSVTLFSRALNAAGPTYTTHLNLAEGYASRGDTIEAATHYQQAITMDPNQPKAYSNLATALQDLGYPKEAMAALDQALLLAPHMTQILVNRASLLDDLDRPAEALRDLALAFALEPELLRARQGLAAMLSRVPRQEAIRSLQEAVDEAPEPKGLVEILEKLREEAEERGTGHE